MDVQNILGTSEHQSKKKQNRHPEPRKHTKDTPFGYLGVFDLYFFGTMRIFSKRFGLHQRPPFNYFDNLQHNGCQKISKGPPLTVFGTVKKSHYLIFPRKFSNVFKGCPFNFFMFCNKLEFQKTEKVPRLQF